MCVAFTSPANNVTFVRVFCCRELGRESTGRRRKMEGMKEREEGGGGKGRKLCINK